MEFSESLQLAVAYAEAGYDQGAETSWRLRSECCAGDAADDVPAAMLGLRWNVADWVTGDSPDPRALKNLLREASTKMEIGGSF